jgi:hypothetical protein
MGRYAQTKNAAIGLDYTNMTAKRGPLYAQNVGVTSTSDKEMKKSCREQEINFILAPLMAYAGKT